MTKQSADVPIVDGDEVFYELTLFVSGASDLAARAIANARRLCDLHCAGRYHLSVVDIHEDPSSLLTNNLLATPTLVKSRPTPVRTGRRRPVADRQGARHPGPSRHSAPREWPAEHT